MQKSTFFASDGSYGDADGIVLIDTTNWTFLEWEEIANMTDSDRYEFALALEYAAKMADAPVDTATENL